MTTNADLAKEVAKLVQLEAVVVRKADLDAAFDPLDLPEELSLENAYRCAHSLSNGANERQRIDVTIEFDFNCRRPSEGGDGEIAVSLTATMLLIYSMKAGADIKAECFDHFANLNGVYNAWPYWREFVQSATARAGLPGVVVPVFRPPVRELEAGATMSTECTSAP